MKLDEKYSNAQGPPCLTLSDRTYVGGARQDRVWQCGEGVMGRGRTRNCMVGCGLGSGGGRGTERGKRAVNGGC